MEHLSKILSFFKQSNRVFGSVFLFCIAFFLIPVEIKKKLYIYDFYNSNRTYISMLMIISMSSLLLSFIKTMYQKIKTLISKASNYNLRRRKLYNLTATEKEICREAMRNDGMVTLDIEYNTGLSLIDNNVMDRVSKKPIDTWNGFQHVYRLNDWTYNYLKKNGTLIIEDKKKRIRY
ncbi:MAG: superinfection exclusion B family protein [Candidatus Lokiarchaeota archaeon]|nr:superinfection exclusion B family protein [Candidatus Lokiarchaeota archaeon]